jgi:hypothetical protein
VFRNDVGIFECLTFPVYASVSNFLCCFTSAWAVTYFFSRSDPTRISFITNSSRNLFDLTVWSLSPGVVNATVRDGRGGVFACSRARGVLKQPVTVEKQFNLTLRNSLIFLCIHTNMNSDSSRLTEP